MLNFILCGDFRFCLSRLLHVIRRRSAHIRSRLTSIFISSIIFDDRQGGSGSRKSKQVSDKTTMNILTHSSLCSIFDDDVDDVWAWLTFSFDDPPHPSPHVTRQPKSHSSLLAASLSQCLSVSFFCGRIKNICKLFPYGRILHSNHLSFYDYSSSFPCSSVSIYN